MASRLLGLPLRGYAFVRREGMAAVGRRIRDGIARRARKTLFRLSERSSIVASTRRVATRGRRRISGRRGRSTLGSESLLHAHEILERLAPLVAKQAAGAQAKMGPATLAVGVVVPACQAADWLDECLMSVFRQSYNNWRCYVIDDGSTDETAAIAHKWEQRDDRFRVIRHGKKGGRSAARNTGLREATEPIITFLDPDDLLLSESLESRVRVLERDWDNPEVAGAWSATPPVPAETSLAEAEGLKRHGAGGVIDFVVSEGERPFIAHAVVVRTALLRRLGGFDERMRHGVEDWDLWQRMFRHGYVVNPADGFAGVHRQCRSNPVPEELSGYLAEARQLHLSTNRWALTDQEIVVDPNAAAPLGVLASGHRSFLSGATHAGNQLASSSAPGVLDDGVVETILEAATRAGVAAVDGAKAARAGLSRGLGLGLASSLLTESDQRRLDDIADAVEARMAAVATNRKAMPPTDAEFVDLRVGQWAVDVLFVAETLADVLAYLPMVRAARSRGQRVGAVDLDVIKGDEGAACAWLEHSIDLYPLNHVAFGRVEVGTVVVRRPIGPVTAELIQQFGSTPVVELRADGRNLELACNERSELPIDRAVDADHEVDAPLPAAMPPDFRSSFGRLLLKEEGSVHPASTVILEELRDKHRGETVVLVGNGPSLNETPIELLSGVPTIAVNGIFYAAERFPDPITYYVVEDTSVFRENLDAIKALKAEYKLFPTLYRDAFSDNEITDRTAFFRMNGGFYGRGTGTRCHPRFSVDPRQRLYCGQSVTIINLQLAYWMGFSRVALIGMDFSYTIPDDVEREGDLITSTSDDVNHFHPDYFGKGKTWKDPKLDRVLVNYRLAGEMFVADGREIVNATVGGNLDVFRRMDLLDAISSSS